MLGKSTPRSVCTFFGHRRNLLIRVIADLESVGQELIEDNIVSVSRQMIDKEASVAKTKPESNGQQNGGMDVDEEL